MTGTDDEITQESRLIAARVRERAAATVPTPASLADIAAGAAAASPGGAMTPDQIRKLAADAIAQAQQIAFLLGQLAVLVDERQPGHP